jgi:hypothetical protein
VVVYHCVVALYVKCVVRGFGTSCIRLYRQDRSSNSSTHPTGILICHDSGVVGIRHVVGIPTTRASRPRTPSPTETDPMSRLSCSWCPLCSWCTDYGVVGVPTTRRTKEITCRSIDRSIDCSVVFFQKTHKFIITSFVLH